MKNTSLVCTNCKKKYPADKIKYNCTDCGEPVEVELISSGVIDRDKNSFGQSTFERYKSFYPYFEIDNALTLGTGFTPLLKYKFDDIDIDNIYVKNETSNPTWSFKDRGTALGIMHAKELGFKKIGTVSSGNMAVSVAAFGKNANLDTLILVNHELSREKSNPINIYGARLIKVEGDYSDLYLESIRVSEIDDRYFINSDVPFRIEGYKTLAFELYEQLNGIIPDYIAIPVSAGGHLRGIDKGFKELEASGIVDKVPGFIVCQPEGCHPIVKAFVNGDEKISKFNKTHTIAHATENAFPPSGNQVLRILGENNGLAVKVTDEEILFSQSKLAEKGIFVQPASAMSVAGVKKLLNSGQISASDTIVCVVTGSGLKYTQVFDLYDFKEEKCKLDELVGIIVKKEI